MHEIRKVGLISFNFLFRNDIFLCIFQENARNVVNKIASVLHSLDPVCFGFFFTVEFCVFRANFRFLSSSSNRSMSPRAF